MTTLSITKRGKANYLEEKVSKVGWFTDKINKIKATADIVLDQLLLWGATASSMVYGIYKIAEKLPDGFNDIACALYGAAMPFVISKIVYPLSKKLARFDKEKLKQVKQNYCSKLKIASWLKTAMLTLAFYFPAMQAAEKTENFYYAYVIGPKISQVVLDEKDSSNLQLAAIGRIQRTERWLPLIRQYEEKFGMPEFTLYAMVMEESYGDPLQINKYDGGAGLVHCQPASWLERKKVGPNNEEAKVFYDANVLASNEYGKKLENMIESAGYDLEAISKIDNRFDVKVNLYEIAEIWGEHYEYFKSLGYSNEIAKKAAIAAIHTGRHGVFVKPGVFSKRAKRYLRRIQQWRNARMNPAIMKLAKKRFNEKNKIPFSRYVKYFWMRY